MRALLERAVAPYEGETGDWDAVLRDARRGRRVTSLRLAFAAAAVATAIAVALPLTGAPPSTLDRALAAAGDGRVLHLVFETERPKQLVDLETGARREVRGRHEVWYDASAGVRERELFEGVVQWDSSASGPDIHPHQREIYSSLGAGYRKALEAGTAKVVRETGSAIWIRIAPGHDVAVSRSTFMPVSMRVAGRETRILAYETLATAPLGATHVPLPEPSTADGGRASLRGGVWTGETFEGLRLASVRRLDLASGERGLRLTYGSHDGRHAELTEARGLADGVTMLAGVRGYAPPARTLLLDESTGLVQAHGSVVAILSPDPETTTAIARALRPAG